MSIPPPPPTAAGGLNDAKFEFIGGAVTGITVTPLNFLGFSSLLIATAIGACTTAIFGASDLRFSAMIAFGSSGFGSGGGTDTLATVVLSVSGTGVAVVGAGIGVAGSDVTSTLGGLLRVTKELPRRSAKNQTAPTVSTIAPNVLAIHHGTDLHVLFSCAFKLSVPPRNWSSYSRRSSGSSKVATIEFKRRICVSASAFRPHPDVVVGA